MNISRIETNGKASATGPLMRQMVYRYCHDMAPYINYTPMEMFKMVKDIPFNPDPPGFETLQRPRYTINQCGTGGDCDDKTIMVACWAHLKNIPFRFVAVRKQGRKILHHVYPELYINGRWMPFDATYNFNIMGQEKRGYVEKVII